MSHVRTRRLRHTMQSGGNFDFILTKGAYFGCETHNLHRGQLIPSSAPQPSFRRLGVSNGTHIDILPPVVRRRPLRLTDHL
jgi:hypothetical protein